MSRQMEFTEKGVEAMSRNLTPKDLEVMRRWKSILGQCPWCMFTSNLWNFATFHRKRKGRTVSEAKCVCPDCGVALKHRTLVKIFNMGMKSYGKWFWGAVFSGSYEKVSWELLKNRLNEGFNYDDRRPFWDQYWAHKELSPGGWQESEDDEDYEDYKRAHMARALTQLREAKFNVM